MQVLFCSSTHKVGNASQRAGADDNKGITIDDGCWIGARATILPGVHVYSGCVIAAGAVVVSDCEKNGLYAGVPARRVKELVV
jgi:maltose O-acetyltransferase